MRDSMNREVLDSFAEYCYLHPEQRFWQALRNWSGYDGIFAHKDMTSTEYLSDWYKLYIKENDKIVDTFYWEGKNDEPNRS